MATRKRRKAVHLGAALIVLTLCVSGQVARSGTADAMMRWNIPRQSVLNDNANAYLYDAEGRLCAVKNLMAGTMTEYIYDAEGSRVAKGSLSSWPSLPQTPLWL